MGDFASALMTLWPEGDSRIIGLRAGIIASAPAVFAKYRINSPLVLTHLMAQMSHECGAGFEVVEDLNYSAKRIVEVWPRRFRTEEEALPYAHNPQGLANRVYNGRMGNRMYSNDGWLFRGRGGTQVTGRDNYTSLAGRTGLDLLNRPDLVNYPEFFLECAVADFIQCGCIAPANNDDILEVTKKLNGGTVGLNQREEWFRKWEAFDVTVPQPEAGVVITPAPLPEGPKPASWGSWFKVLVEVLKDLFGRGK